MGLFDRKTHPVLEEKLRELQVDMANNYKDNAQDDFIRLGKAYEELLHLFVKSSVAL